MRFIRVEKNRIVAAMESILNHVIHEKSVSPTNLSSEYDDVCERDGSTKQISLYHERRFAKLGYLAGAISEAIPLINILHDEAHTQYLHTESVRAYLEYTYIITALTVLSWFSYNISLSLLNRVEKGNQSPHGPDKLWTIFPKLY